MALRFAAPISLAAFAMQNRLAAASSIKHRVRRWWGERDFFVTFESRSEMKKPQHLRARAHQIWLPIETPLRTGRVTLVIPEKWRLARLAA